MKRLDVLVLFLCLAVKLQLGAKENEATASFQYADEVISIFVDEVKKDYGLVCQTREKFIPYRIEEISVGLLANESATIDQARELVVKLTERFVQIINAHEKIRPFLQEYPFPAVRVFVGVIFTNSKKAISLSNKKNVLLVFQEKNRVYYKTGASNNSYPADTEDESYEDALKIVRNKGVKKGGKSYATANPTELPRSQLFFPEDAKVISLQGKIVNGRYYSPKNIFSCQADDFGEGTYLANDLLHEASASVAFCNRTCNFKKADILFIPELETTNVTREDLKGIYSFCMDILNNVENAENIEVLNEEFFGNEMLFRALSIEKMATLKDSYGRNLSCTRGCLIFKDKDKAVILTNQKVTPLGQKHNPKEHVDMLKKDILSFKKTFEFGSIPTDLEERKNENGAEKNIVTFYLGEHTITGSFQSDGSDQRDLKEQIDYLREEYGFYDGKEKQNSCLKNPGVKKNSK